MRDSEMLKQIVDLIIGYKKLEKIVVFGSRARSDFREVSDIDIAVFGHDWTDTDINLVKDILHEHIKTPLKIDVVNFYQIKNKKLKTNILKEGKAIYEP